MDPKEKAKELVGKFFIYSDNGYAKCMKIAKQCALIAVEEILIALNDNHDHKICEVEFTYWKEVKQEIENYKN